MEHLVYCILLPAIANRQRFTTKPPKGGDVCESLVELQNHPWPMVMVGNERVCGTQSGCPRIRTCSYDLSIHDFSRRIAYRERHVDDYGRRQSSARIIYLTLCRTFSSGFLTRNPIYKHFHTRIFQLLLFPPAISTEPFVQQVSWPTSNPLTSGKVKAAMESSDGSFEDWRASSPDCPSVASEYQEPLESSSDTREEEIADRKSAPSQGLIFPSRDRKTSGHAYGYGSGQKPYDNGVTTQRTTQSALEATGRQSIQRLALRLAKDNVTKLVAKQVGMEAKKSFRATRRPLFLAQTECEIGFQVKVYLCMDEEDSASEGSAPELGMNIIFDPKSDAIMLFNRTKGDEQQFITVRKRPISNAWVPIRIGSSERAMLDPASYSISWSGKHILDMTVFPRRYMSLVPRYLKPLTKSRKRALEELASQSSPPPVKKYKAKEANEGSSVSTAIQIDDDVIAVSGPTASSSLRSKFNLINDLCHPMEALKLHDAIKVVNSIEEEDYTLTRKADIAVHRKSLVFKARHSDAAEELIVVKLLRSHSEIKHKDDKVMGIDVVGERWLKEVKNHCRVSEHVSQGHLPIHAAY